MPIAHCAVHTADLPRSKAFYAAALKPLGYRLFLDLPAAVGFTTGMSPDFWTVGQHFERAKKQSGKTPEVLPTHVAFRCGSRSEVRRWYDAMIAAGGKDNGAPRVRPEHAPGYYSAYVFDPDGNNMEALCFSPWWMYVIQYGKYAVGMAGLTSVYWMGQKAVLGAL